MAVCLEPLSIFYLKFNLAYIWWHSLDKVSFGLKIFKAVYIYLDKNYFNGIQTQYSKELITEHITHLSKNSLV